MKYNTPGWGGGVCDSLYIRPPRRRWRASQRPHRFTSACQQPCCSELLCHPTKGTMGEQRGGRPCAAASCRIARPLLTLLFFPRRPKFETLAAICHSQEKKKKTQSCDACASVPARDNSLMATPQVRPHPRLTVRQSSAILIYICKKKNNNAESLLCNVDLYLVLQFSMPRVRPVNLKLAPVVLFLCSVCTLFLFFFL